MIHNSSLLPLFYKFFICNLNFLKLTLMWLLWEIPLKLLDIYFQLEFHSFTISYSCKKIKYIPNQMQMAQHREVIIILSIQSNPL